MRLDKFLADCMIGTRSELKKMIKNGRVKVNGQVVKDCGMTINETKDQVLFDDEIVEYEKMRYFMLNKPAGCVSATRDKLSDTVISFLEGENTKDLFPVGRLDKDTEGLLLITNDGVLAHNLLSPKKHVDKKYLVHSDKKLSTAEMSKFEKGVDIGDEKPCLPALLEFEEDEKDYFVYYITIHEGRFHQVKRMFEAFGANVIYLKRISMGKLKLDENLAPGEYKKLSIDDIV